MNPVDECELKKLKWRCRRGAKELDVLLTAYLDRSYLQSSDTEKSAMARLLDSQDPDLLSWIIGLKEAPDPELKHLVKKIRETTL